MTVHVADVVGAQVIGEPRPHPREARELGRDAGEAQQPPPGAERAPAGDAERAVDGDARLLQRVHVGVVAA